MITSLSTVAHHFAAIAQEGNAEPGESLSAIQTLTYFVGIPVALFVIIGGLAWIGGREKSTTKRDNINSID